MCHILLALPLLALPLFFVLPLPMALPIYAAVAVFSAAIYWFAIQAMKQPRLNGAAGMIGKTGEVIENRDGKLLLRVQNEIWAAISAESRPNRGDRLKVVGVEDLTLLVRELSPDTESLGRSPKLPATARMKRELRRIFLGLEA